VCRVLITWSFAGSGFSGSGFRVPEFRFPGSEFVFFTLVTGPRRSLSLQLSDTRVYEPHIRARIFGSQIPKFRVSGLPFVRDGTPSSKLTPLQHLLRISSLGLRVSAFGFRVSGFGFRVSGFGFRVSGLAFRVCGSSSGVSGVWCGVSVCCLGLTV